MRRIVGLTDGIASGTSSVSDMFESHGIPVVYADDVARAALKKVTDRRRCLDELLTPHIIKGVFRETTKLWMKGHRVVVLDASMLFESGMDREMDQTIVVWVDQKTQIRRLKARGKISEQDAMNMINAEMSLDLKKNKAKRVIDNTGSQVYLKKQFEDIFDEVSRPLP
ncbi:hypothetical protein K1719_002045 [Acacia pycnantha]|nr:hypothetical protein K1719_002045 [Acacia pycnantha]